MLGSPSIACRIAAWDLVDIEDYRSAWKSAHGYFSINLVSSRGCPYRCNWCAKPVFGVGHIHFRSPQDACARKWLRVKNELGAEHIWFADDIFALSPQWTRAFADAVEHAGAQPAVQDAIALRSDDSRHGCAHCGGAGCAEVWMGAESGSQKILDAMDKGTRVAQIYEARENLRRHGIRACYFLQFGYPGETWADIERTIRMVRETDPDDIGVSVSYPLPGTRFHARVAEELGEKANWRDSDDVSMMFRGAYSTEFYRELADAVHAEVRGGRSAMGSRVRARKRVRQEDAGMDLLLTHGYFLAEDAREREIMKPYAPLGLLYLSSHLRARGFDVEIYDSTFGSREELLRAIATERPRVVGIYGNLMTRGNVVAIAEAARAARMPRGDRRAGAGQLRGSNICAPARMRS